MSECALHNVFRTLYLPQPPATMRLDPFSLFPGRFLHERASSPYKPPRYYKRWEKLAKRGLTLQPRPPLTGVSRALRARNPERVSKGLPAPGSKKCPKQSRNSLQSLKIDCFETPETVSRLFRTLSGPWGRKAPGDSFETLSGLRARRARETPVRGGRGCRSNLLIAPDRAIEVAIVIAKTLIAQSGVLWLSIDRDS